MSHSWLFGNPEVCAAIEEKRLGEVQGQHLLVSLSTRVGSSFLNCTISSNSYASRLSLAQAQRQHWLSLAHENNNKTWTDTMPYRVGIRWKAHRAQY